MINCKGAIADYTKSISLDEKNSVTFSNRALAYDALGNKEKSESDWRIYNLLKGAEKK